MKLYFQYENVLAGITLKDETKNEANNMALHACSNEADVVINRIALARALNVTIDDFVCAEQTHSENAYFVQEKDRGRGARELQSAVKDTDALYTDADDIVLCTFTADCVPVFFHHKEADVIGVIHSGWKGTVQEITKKTLKKVMEQFQCRPDGFHIQIGMALSQKRFEVDYDVYEQFVQLGYAEPFITYNRATNKYHIDNQRVVMKQCESIGIKLENIQLDPTCTYESETGFSYRQNRQAGRHLGFILKKSY